MDDILASVPHQAARPGASVEGSRWNYSTAALRNIIAIWGERTRFRRDLDQKSKTDPHLIDDIGLTRQQVEAEIAKPFWQA